MEHYHWFALRSVPHVGNVAFVRLVARLGSPERVLAASPDELAAIPGIGSAAVRSLVSWDWRPFAETEAQKADRHGVRIVDYLSTEYPKLLLEIPDFPPYLYVRGNLSALDAAIAIVGSRRASSPGLHFTKRLAAGLAGSGVAVVSGLARGIDTAAHRGALSSGGFTVGVLGCGIDVAYPAENRELIEEMAQKGAVVSEFPLGTAPLAENFPRRNRIISGMSRGVVVVEAAESSGSLITADFALEQGREVFAVPGAVGYPGSRGPNRLIKQGAKLVESVEDILGELSFCLPAEGATKKQHFALAADEAEVYALIARSPLHIDEIIVQSALTVGEVSAILLRLELKGAITQLPGKHFAISS